MKTGMKTIALVLLVVYTSGCAGQSVFPGYSHQENDVVRRNYDREIQKREQAIIQWNTRGSSFMSTSAATAAIGLGLWFGSDYAKQAIRDIPVQPKDVKVQEDIDTAIDALNTTQDISFGVLAVGGSIGLGMVYCYWRSRHYQEKRNELARGKAEYEKTVRVLEAQTESYQTMNDVAARLKKNVGRKRGFQHIFSKLGATSVLSGGFLYGLSRLTDNIIEQIDIDETAENDVYTKYQAIAVAEDLKDIGTGLMIGGGASWLIGFFLGRSAKGDEEEIDKLEKSLFPAIAQRVSIQPTFDGVMVTYSHQF